MKTSNLKKYEFSTGRAAAWPLALALLATPLAGHAGTDEKAASAAAAQRAMPVLAAQPVSAVVTAGRPVSFKVLATSPTKVSYQWLRDGRAIIGATANNYVILASALADNGATFTVSAKNAAGTVVSGVARLTVNAIMPQAASADRPFSDQSPWNARPTAYTLGTFQVPTSTYFPAVEEGTWSTGAFVASAADPSVTVLGPSAGSDLWVPDAEASVPQMVIPHWPAGVVPAPGADGHADIIDPSTNRIHSFYQLRLVDGQWRAAQYTWTALDSRGFGTPGQYQQGARAAGVPPSAGLIRKSEVDDGLPGYRHALAMSMTFTALSKGPAFTFPATNADWDASTANSGAIPEGALMMLPASFDLSTITNPRLLKIARTLQSFGAYVVDRNTGTPFVIYVENGSNFNLMPNGWDDEIGAQLDRIRAGIRQVVATTEWTDASGAVFVPEHRLNLLSMRGYWWVAQGSAPGVFDTQTQSVVFPATGSQTVQVNAGGRSMPSVFGAPVAGQQYTLKVSATGGATIKLDLMANGAAAYSSGVKGDGTTLTFTWPVNGAAPYVWAYSAPQGGGSVTATLTAVTQ